MDEQSASIIPQFIQRNLAVIAIGISGLVLIIIGIISVTTPKSDGVIIEKAASHTSDTPVATPTAVIELVIDVEGAVEKPGIYHLPSESREQDAITAAGGFSAKADQGAIAKGMNLAAKVTDGTKLYVPFTGEQPMTTTGDAAVAGAQTGSISINQASEPQLDSLPGVGSVTAGKIIQNRPYSSVDDLLTKKSCDQGDL